MHGEEAVALMETPASLTRSSGRLRASLFAQASPEFLLVAACCRWPPEKAEPAIDRLLRQGTFHWPSLLRLAERHRVTGFVANALRGRPELPVEIAAKLAQRAAQIQRENLAHIAVALRVGRLLESESIPFLVLKGAPLSQLAFGTTALRHMRDIDLLVSEVDAEGGGARAAFARI